MGLAMKQEQRAGGCSQHPLFLCVCVCVEIPVQNLPEKTLGPLVKLGSCQ